jgi:hypothetical protein
MGASNPVDVSTQVTVSPVTGGSGEQTACAERGRPSARMATPSALRIQTVFASPDRVWGVDELYDGDSSGTEAILSGMKFLRVVRFRLERCSEHGANTIGISDRALDT